MSNKDFDAACKFYRNNVNKAFTLTYDQRLTLSALYNQSKFGAFSSDKAPQVGPLDFIGKERRAKWQSLGSMSKTEAQDTFVQSLLQICPQFAAHLEAADTMHVPNDAELKTQGWADSTPPSVHGVTGCRSSSTKVSDLTKKESQIRNALNAQTLEQFKTYAAQYYPDDEAKQVTLIRQLQDRHFHQYMIHVTGHPSAQSAAIFEENASQKRSDAQSASQTSSGSTQNEECSRNQDSVDSTLPGGETTSTLVDCLTTVPKQPPTSDLMVPIPDGTCNLTAPQMWTRKDIAEFKTLLSKDPEAVVRVGSGELVTIRVPVVSSANCLVWEFATDDYDIGFGLYFEWAEGTVKPESALANGNEQAQAIEASLAAPWNLIQGFSQPPANNSNAYDKVEELIPVYRRTSHIEVYCGSHVYPASGGTYLLKFDNTYSIWRSKILYYRVYCAQ